MLPACRSYDTYICGECFKKREANRFYPTAFRRDAVVWCAMQPGEETRSVIKTADGGFVIDMPLETLVHALKALR